jgi:4-azaleucine resistance transporter AzlC
VRDLRRGLLAALPLAPGIAAFGLLYGMMARQAGLSPWEALAMSMMLHAGSAQFTALGMWGVAGAAPIILTTLVVNLRHLLMGASIAPYLRGLSTGWKALLALWMSDESYALAIAEYERGQAPKRGYGVPGSQGYFLGANLGVYVVWAASGLLGALLGTAIPDPARYGLDLVFPLAFLGLMMAFIKDRIGAAVALAAAVFALLGVYWLPGKWYVIVAGLLGSGLGVVLEEVIKPCRTC